MKDISEIIENLATALAIIIGGGWTLWRFGLFRERFAKMEFNLDCRFIGKSGNDYLIEIIATMENKGSVRQTIKKFTFDLLLFNETNVIDETIKKINYQVNFPNKKISRRPWVPNPWEETFIDAGTIQVYRYLTSIPADTEFISVYSKFIYPNSNDFHSAQMTFNVNHLIQKVKPCPGE